MSQGKFLSLEEARKSGRLDRFAKAHPSEGDATLFGRLLSEMAKTTEAAEETSLPEPAANSNETQTRRDT